ncbi:MAG: winged helix-turn-helix transcriptional regulator [Ruminococcus bicirculans (ex Wegman et al. 2014)]
MDQLIKLLKNNARITNSELAVLLDKTEEQVAADIAKLEADGVIRAIPRSLTKVPMTLIQFSLL